MVAVKWKLSSRHPVFDLCDMYAKADMYGLGAGVFLKDKVPALPVHPHCLCRMVEIYRGELKSKEKERIREAGDEWLKKLNNVQRESVLGIEGEKAWQAGGDWRKYARGWAGLRTAKSRLSTVVMTRRRTGKQGQQIIDKAVYDKLIQSFVKSGGVIIRGEEARCFLDKQNASASYITGSKVAFIRDEATISDVLEEMYHAKQDRRGDYNDLPFNEMVMKREIDAQKYLLRVSEKYKIPIEEIKVTRENLKMYRKKLQKLPE